MSGCTCTCATGYTGSSCNACATNYTGYPTCTAAPCTTATTTLGIQHGTAATLHNVSGQTATNCNGHATAVSGNLVSGCTCTCATGYTGSSCNTCATNYTGYPTCTAAPCTTATNCNGHATTVSGNLVSGCTCTCATGYTGSSCNACVSPLNVYPSCLCAVPLYGPALPLSDVPPVPSLAISMPLPLLLRATVFGTLPGDGVVLLTQQKLSFVGAFHSLDSLPLDVLERPFVPATFWAQPLLADGQCTLVLDRAINSSKCSPTSDGTTLNCTFYLAVVVPSPFNASEFRATVSRVFVAIVVSTTGTAGMGVVGAACSLDDSLLSCQLVPAGPYAVRSVALQSQWPLPFVGPCRVTDGTVGSWACEKLNVPSLTYNVTFNVSESSNQLIVQVRIVHRRADTGTFNLSHGIVELGFPENVVVGASQVLTFLVRGKDPAASAPDVQRLQIRSLKTNRTKDLNWTCVENGTSTQNVTVRVCSFVPGETFNVDPTFFESQCLIEVQLSSSSIAARRSDEVLDCIGQFAIKDEDGSTAPNNAKGTTHMSTGAIVGVGVGVGVGLVAIVSVIALVTWLTLRRRDTCKVTPF